MTIPQYLDKEEMSYRNRGFVIKTLLEHIGIGDYFTIANNGKDIGHVSNYRYMENKKFRTITEGTIITVVRLK